MPCPNPPTQIHFRVPRLRTGTVKTDADADIDQAVPCSKTSDGLPYPLKRQ